MGCCTSAPEQPRKKSNSMSYKANPGPPGGAGGPPPGSQQVPANYRYTPGMGHPGAPVGGHIRQGPPPQGYMMGGPPQVGGHMVPQVGGAMVPQVGGGPQFKQRSALMFVGLYRYDARTPEDLSFEKGIVHYTMQICVVDYSGIV